MSQLVDFYNASMYYKKYKNSLKRVSAKVGKIFQYKNFVNTVVKYRLMREFISSSSLEESLKIPFFSNLLSDPIYLLMAYSSLKNEKSGGIDNIPVYRLSQTPIQASSQLPKTWTLPLRRYRAKTLMLKVKIRVNYKRLLSPQHE